VTRVRDHAEELDELNHGLELLVEQRTAAFSDREAELQAYMAFTT